jgi:hypothetical protein
LPKSVVGALDSCPAQPKTLGELALCREDGAGGQGSVPDQAFKLLFELLVERHRRVASQLQKVRQQWPLG